MTSDLHWWTASDLAAAIRGREVSAREALEHFVTRDRASSTRRSTPSCHWDLDRARRQPRASPTKPWPTATRSAPLHGVPMTIKDSFQTEGCITTSGAPDFAEYRARRRRLAGRQASSGGCDPVRQDQPADLRRRHPELQRRVRHDQQPARPRPARGRVVGRLGGGALDGLHADRARLRHRRLDPRPRPLLRGDGPQAELRHRAQLTGRSRACRARSPQADLAVAGPMARSIGDLELELDVLAGPDRWNAPAWRLELPPARATTLAAFGSPRGSTTPTARSTPPHGACSRETVAAIESAGGQRRHRGATRLHAREGRHRVQASCCSRRSRRSTRREKVEHMAANTDDSPLGFVKRATAARHRDWLADNERRLQIRERWRLFFEHYDVILMPVQPRGAIPHDHSLAAVGPHGRDRRRRASRTSTCSAGPVPPAPGCCPATVVPAGIGRRRAADRCPDRRARTSTTAPPSRPDA